jgi:glutamyl-tRNA reductase
MPLRSLIVAGINHRTASIEKRECLALDGDALRDAYQDLQDRGVEQAVILSTCNRTEVYAVGCAVSTLEAFFAARQGIPASELPDVMYLHRDQSAVRHLFRVASGLDSQVLGESEVLGQVKKAWAVAREEGMTASFLDSAFQHAVTAGKRVRTETGLGKQVVSIASLALRLAAQEHPDIAEHTVLIVGTGEMGRRIVQELECYRPRQLYVMSHTLAYAEDLARAGGGEAVAISQLGHILPDADVVFTVTTAPHPILDRTELAPLARQRADRPLSIFDLGVPRNTAPEVRDLPFVSLHDIDDLKALSEAHRRSREREVPAAERIIDEELEQFVLWCRQRGVAPLITALRQRAEQIRQRQLARALSQIGPISDEQREAIDRMTVHLVKQLLHYPITELRDAAGEEDTLAVVARLVGVAPGERPHGSHPGRIDPN